MSNVNSHPSERILSDDMKDGIKNILKFSSSAGEPLNPDLIEWWQSHFNHPIKDHYGQSETGMVINNHWRDHNHRTELRTTDSISTCMGRSMPGFRCVVLNENGDEVYDQPGILSVDVTPTVDRPGITASPLMWWKGYWNNEEKTKETFYETPIKHTSSEYGVRRYYKSGDIATMRRNSFNAHIHHNTSSTDKCEHDTSNVHNNLFWYSSRSDDVIKSSGYRIGPSDIENCVLSHGGVAEVAALGYPDQAKGEV
jgi:acetyl-CoA synthetase